MMSAEAAAAFMNSPYNKLADIKMLVFFLNISTTGILIFGFLIIMSILFEHFWCRYLCPYGALLGLLGWFSPSKIRRQAHQCIDCGNCDRVCPGQLKVSKSGKINSPECNGCLDCIESCPVTGALDYGFTGRSGIGSVEGKHILPAAMLAVFILVIAVAMLTGNWNSIVTVEEVSALYQFIGSF